MRAADPPTLATRLLEWLVSGPHREAIVGDLIEQYRQGRSGRWYWRQVLLAVVVDVAKELRDNKLLAACSVATGLAIYLAAAFPVNGLARLLSADRIAPVAWLRTWLLESGHDWLAFWFGQLFPNRLLSYIAGAVSGCIVARIRPRIGFALVCAYAASVLLLESVHVYVGLLIDAGRHPITTHFLTSWVLLLGRPLSALVGGLVALPKEPRLRRIIQPQTGE